MILSGGEGWIVAQPFRACPAAAMQP